MRKHGLVWVMVVLLCTGAAAVTVRLRPEVTVSGEVVRLRDVAVIRNASAEMAKLLGELRVSMVPARGTTLALTRAQVYERMLVAGVNLSEVVVVGPGRVLVKRSKGGEAPVSYTHLTLPTN